MYNKIVLDIIVHIITPCGKSLLDKKVEVQNILTLHVQKEELKYRDQPASYSRENVFDTISPLGCL